MGLLHKFSVLAARTSLFSVVSVVVFFGTNHGQTARADAPQVQFDLPYSVAARDVSPPDFRQAYPHEKLVEIKLQISSLLVSGDERDLRQYMFRIVSPQHTVQVVDYLPKTLHESPVAGNIAREQSEEKTASLGINVSGQYEVGIDPHVNGGAGQKSSSSVKYELLPPKESVAASGTILRGTGVYFKLKASDRNLLEGARDVALVLRVPLEWRADYLHVRCEADGYSRSFTRSLDSVVPAGERDFLVVVYQEGDAAARAIAEEMARREAYLRRAAHTTVRVEKPTITFGKLLALPTVAEKRPLPEDWLRQVLFAGSSSGVIARLPRDLREPAEAYTSARTELSKLNGWQSRREATAAALAQDEVGRR